MPVTLDQILTSTRLDLPGARAGGSALEREAADRPAPTVARVARSGARRWRVIAEVKRRSPSAGIDPRRPGSGGARGAVRGAGCGRHFGPHRRPSLRRLGRRPPRGRCGGHGAGAAQGLHPRRASDRRGACGGRRGGAAHRPRARSPSGSRPCSTSARAVGLDALVEVHTGDRAAPGARGGRGHRRGQQPGPGHFPHRHGVRLGAAGDRARRDRRRRRERHARARRTSSAPPRPAPTRC